MKPFTVIIKDTSRGDITMTKEEFDRETKELIEKTIAQTVYVVEEKNACIRTHLFFIGVVLGFLITKFVF